MGSVSIGMTLPERHRANIQSSMHTKRSTRTTQTRMWRITMTASSSLVMAIAKRR